MRNLLIGIFLFVSACASAQMTHLDSLIERNVRHPVNTNSNARLAGTFQQLLDSLHDHIIGGSPGSVTSVTGTSNRITSSGGTSPVINISASYVGQSSITTLGTITTGTWNGSVNTGQYGGTGVANTGKTITLGGNLTTSGPFNSTLAVSGSNTYTFQNASYTLAGTNINNTFGNTQTFTNSPVVPTPSGGTDAANKNYVDTSIGAAALPAFGVGQDGWVNGTSSANSLIKGDNSELSLPINAAYIDVLPYLPLSLTTLTTVLPNSNELDFGETADPLFGAFTISDYSFATITGNSFVSIHGDPADPTQDVITTQLNTTGTGSTSGIAFGNISGLTPFSSYGNGVGVFTGNGTATARLFIDDSGLVTMDNTHGWNMTADDDIAWTLNSGGTAKFIQFVSNNGGVSFLGGPTGTQGFTVNQLGAIAVSATGGSFEIDLGSDATGDSWYRNSSGLVTRRGIGSTDQVYKVSGGLPTWGALNLSAAAAITGDLPFANLTQGSARSVLGVTGNSTADAASIQGTTDQILRINGAGNALAFGSIDLSKSAAVGSSLLSMANGGTAQALSDPGANTIWGWDDTDNAVTQYTIGSGLTYTHSTHTLSSSGGFSNPMTTLGDIIYEDSGPSAARLAGNTTTTKKYLSQTGNGTISAAPTWSVVDQMTDGSSQLTLASSTLTLGVPTFGTVVSIARGSIKGLDAAVATIFAGSDNNGAGGDAYIKGGTNNGSSNGNGGNAVVQGGAGFGTGVEGTPRAKYAGVDQNLTNIEYVTESTTSRTLAEADRGRTIKCSNAGSITITLPNGLSTGFWCRIIKESGAGVITFSASTTLVSLNSLNTLNTDYAQATVEHRGSNVWLLAGQLGAQ